MKKLLLIPLILAGCSTATTEKRVEPEPQLAVGFACVQVQPADPFINNLIENGHDVDYNGSTNQWIIDGVVVGSSENEDEGFALCAERLLYDELVKSLP